MKNIDKNLLIQTLNLNDNIYLDKYIELIYINRDRNKSKNKTQKHHIIPKYYYKENNLDLDNTIQNTVNLLYTDHIIAHCYLCLCSRIQKNVFANFCAIIKLLGHNIDNKYNVDYHNIEDLILYLNNNNIEMNNIYEDYKKYKRSINPLYKMNEKEKMEHYSNLSKKLKGRITIHKLGQEKKIDKTELELYKNDGWELGRDPLIKENNIAATKKSNIGKTPVNKGLPQSEEIKQKIRDRIEFRHINDIKYKPCSENRKKAISDANKGRIYIHKNDIVKSIHKNELDYYLMDGWLLGNPNASTCKNRVWINDGVNDYIVDKDKAEELLKNSQYSLGSIKRKQKLKNFIWVYKEEKRVRINPYELEKYEKEGWKKGFPSKRWKKEDK